MIEPGVHCRSPVVRLQEISVASVKKNGSIILVQKRNWNLSCWVHEQRRIAIFLGEHQGVVQYKIGRYE